MEHPIQGVSSLQDRRTNATLLNGGTSLKLSEGDISPVLEAHPGSPVEISDRTRPSLAASYSQRLYHGSDAEFARFERRKLEGKRGGAIKRDGVAAKGYFPAANRDAGDDEDSSNPPNKLMQVAGMQPFYIPAKISEQDEARPTSRGGSMDIDSRVSLDTEMAMQFNFKTENGVWISANPLARKSSSSLATTNTGFTNSTMVDDRMSHGALTVDTSVASSAASVMSSVGSIQSATTAASADIYGWEEELERKETIESNMVWERDHGRRLPSGGRTRHRTSIHSFSNKHAGDGRRKSLLSRVLNISGSRRGSVEEGTPPLPSTGSPSSPERVYPDATFPDSSA